jgi:hypothetical protein
MVVFPAWMQHFVDPHASDEPRVVVSFNAVVRPASSADLASAFEWQPSKHTASEPGTDMAFSMFIPAEHASLRSAAVQHNEL